MNDEVGVSEDVSPGVGVELITPQQTSALTADRFWLCCPKREPVLRSPTRHAPIQSVINLCK